VVQVEPAYDFLYKEGNRNSLRTPAYDFLYKVGVALEPEA